MRRGFWRQALLGLAALALSVYAALLGWLWWQQESLIFRPTPLPADYRYTLPADAHEVFIDVPGARLHGLQLQRPGARGLVFFLHGNAGNLERWFVDLDFYRSLNYDVFMLDYRGFGKSSGQVASQAQLQADVRAAWDQVAPAYAGRRIVLLGRSLGTGLAAELAASLPAAQRPDLLLLVSPYRSMVAMAAEQYPYVPSPLLRYPLRTDQALQQLAGSGLRVLLVHGDRDRLIPLAHSQALLRLLPGATLHTVAGGGHGDLQAFDDYERTLRSAIKALDR
ncbi:lysophospholipase [Aquincola tertiaricarbonis]|uniref:Lysophospholipase n=1 Tax=Aquincola tertiaricarbonis TaxID=391953 RepID=A0ABY4SA21_AQUTE|nr:alpha/beta fold hydrolase [Aquincola tertiaricarbonis]URI10208.1 lysophospholipase [Aquincola tertiaricarbonis]